MKNLFEGVKILINVVVNLDLKDIRDVYYCDMRI